jgi:hypothetical protein
MKRIANMAQSPVIAELIAGIKRVSTEWSRMCTRVSIQRKLRAIDREEFRAVRETEWSMEELARSEANLARLQTLYASQRRALYRQLRDTNPDHLVGGGNAAA